MYIARVPNRKSPPAILLRESYREDGKVKNRTLANLTKWAPERIEALERALKGDFDGMSGTPTCGPIFGVLFVLKVLAERLGITKALGYHRKARLALFLVLARVARQGSRLAAVRWAENHAVDDLLRLGPLVEDHLYEALDWLAEKQPLIEDKLFRTYVDRCGTPPVLTLYDVTSSYLEGECNELAEYGYNRDGKRGKKQIVVGLLTADDGHPLAIRVFRGNTTDSTTVGEQIDILRNRFGIDEVVFVGDRGMVKAKGKNALMEAGYPYITALTNPQIRKLLKDKVLQPELFDETVRDVDLEEDEGRRLVLRRNPQVLRKERHRRESKLQMLQAKIEERNRFVDGSERAKPEAGLTNLQEWATHHKLSGFVDLRLDGRMILCDIDEDAKVDVGLLDGCYALETVLNTELLDAEAVDRVYRSLQRVERDFRTMKTGWLEIRPIYVRKESRTRGHAVVMMLALIIAREIQQGLAAAFGTTDEDPYATTWDDALENLSRLTFDIYEEAGQPFQRLVKPDEKQQAVLDALDVNWPSKPPARKRA